MVEARLIVLDHRMAHEEPVQVDGRCRQGQLGQFKHDSHLRDEVDALLTVCQLLRDRHSFDDTGSEEELFGREQPL